VRLALVRGGEALRFRRELHPQAPVSPLEGQRGPIVSRENRLTTQGQRLESVGMRAFGGPSGTPRVGQHDLLAEGLQAIMCDVPEFVRRPLLSIEGSRQVIRLLDDLGQPIPGLGRMVCQGEPPRCPPLTGHMLREKAGAPPGVRSGGTVLFTPLLTSIPLRRPAGPHVELADVVQ